jgi:DNA-binding transcriptional ArsR family regulator
MEAGSTQSQRTPCANRLSHTDVRLLEQLHWMGIAYQARTKAKAPYAWPSRAWLAARLGISIRTVSRHTSKLQRLELLRVTVRRQERGRWQSNLYQLTGRIARAIASTWRRLVHALPRDNNGPLAPYEGAVTAPGPCRAPPE